MGWQAEIVTLEDDRVLQGRWLSEGLPVSFSNVLEGWCSDDAARASFIEVMRSISFDAFFWETPPVTRGRLDRPFECVWVRADGLAGRAPDRRSFADQLETRRGESVVEFANLGGDAWMVVPAPRADAPVYAHLASFSRGAPEAQQHRFWAAVGAAALERIGERPLWINTSGLGVLWLHVRLDRRPKYYTFAPYRSVG